MNERMSSGQACSRLVRRALTNFRLPYITITPTFSICPVHGYLAGEHFVCEKCAEERPASEPQACEVWTRVMGYFRPVASFNIGKKGEYAERTPFTEKALTFPSAPSSPRERVREGSAAQR
jgi:anaerobic ribonucleoside-triphosphate reductase (fragment)